MDIREATEDDGPAIRGVAEQSMQASYSLSPDAIEQAISEWYGPEKLSEKFDDDEVLLFVAEDDEDGVIAFSESALLGEGRADLLWLHVSPPYRGQGLGDDLFEATSEHLREQGVESVRGRVLADNVEGNEFYEEKGFERVGRGEVDIGGEVYVENVYLDTGRAEMEVRSVDGEREVYVDHDDPERGSKGPFYVAYEDPERESRYSYVCGNCGNLVTTMGSMGNMQCDECGNTSKPTRWDAAYM